MAVVNPYKILGVSVNSSKNEIKSQYRKLSRLYHPDNLKTGDADKFREVAEAYTYLEKMNFKTPIKKVIKRYTHVSLFKVKEVS